MKVILLKDIDDGTVDAVIVTNVTSAKEIEERIQRVKEEKEGDYQWEDIVSCLPSDCVMYDRWSSLEVAYY